MRLVTILLLVATASASFLAAPATASTDCVEVDTATFAERNAVILHTGRQIAVGAAVEGVGSAVVYVSPSLCTGPIVA